MTFLMSSNKTLQNEKKFRPSLSMAFRNWQGLLEDNPNQASLYVCLRPDGNAPASIYLKVESTLTNETVRFENYRAPILEVTTTRKALLERFNPTFVIAPRSWVRVVVSHRCFVSFLILSLERVYRHGHMWRLSLKCVTFCWRRY